MNKVGLCTTMALTIALMLTTTTGICANEVNQIVKARQDKFTILGRTVKALDHELGRSVPDRAVLAKDATTIAALAVELPDWFPAGSGPSAVRTAAKTDIWTKPADFRKAEDSLISNARQLAQISSSNDLTAVGRQAKSLSESCGECHHAFRSKWGLLFPW
jgi:cytochrome c556